MGLSTPRTFDGGRRTFPVFIVVCLGTFSLRHGDIGNMGNMAPKKTRLVRAPSTPDAQSHVLAMKRATPSDLGSET